jgi:hypothetical protein
VRLHGHESTLTKPSFRDSSSRGGGGLRWGRSGRGAGSSTARPWSRTWHRRRAARRPRRVRGGRRRAGRRSERATTSSSPIDTSSSPIESPRSLPFPVPVRLWGPVERLGRASYCVQDQRRPDSNCARGKLARTPSQQESGRPGPLNQCI